MRPTPLITTMNDSEGYLQRRNFFAGMLTIYGRKPVLDALNDPDIKPYRLHLADSNRQSNALRNLQELAEKKGAEVIHHSREALSRISKNRRQDQGVVLDINAPNYQSIEELNAEQQPTLIALENVTNPQNVGMTVRSVGASPASGLLLPRKGTASLDALVIKASAGTLFKTSIFHCEHLTTALPELKQRGYAVYGMSGRGEVEVKQIPIDKPAIYILGNETHGLSSEAEALCDQLVKIPMQNQVESLNVSVAAALIAFRGAI